MSAAGAVPACPDQAVRQAVVSYARKLAGMSAASEASLALYLDLVAPGETELRRSEMARMSGCALVARGILRGYIEHPLLERPYVTGQAMADLVAIGLEAHAVTYGNARLPADGDLVIVGGSPEAGGSEHVWCCVSAVCSPYEHVPADHVLLADGIDGGHRDAGGAQCIIQRAHELQGGWDQTETYRRRVSVVIDVARVIAVFGR